MPGHHFISYSSFDGRDFALNLHDGLTAGTPSFEVWWDRRKLRSGEDWDEQIDEAIGTCQSLLFIMTRDSVKAQSGCKLEWARALQCKKLVIPILLHADARIPLRLLTRHYEDFTGSFEPALARLRARLAELQTPAGFLKRAEDVLADLEFIINHTDDPAKQARIQDEIAEQAKEIERWRRIVADPQAAADRVNESIARGLERERQPEKHGRALSQSRFINHPPGTPPTYFQDRHVENKLAGEFLKDDGKRLLTIVGRGGVGKTAMVCRLLKHLESGQLPDDSGPLEVSGIVYLSAIGARRITTPNLFADLCKLLAHEQAEELERLYKNPQVGTEAKMEALLAAFPHGRTILLLDNFEDLVDAQARQISDAELADALRSLLSLPPHAVKVIITTRVAPRDLALIKPERQTRIDLDEGLESPYAENILRAMDVDGKVGLKSAPDDLLDEGRQRTRGFPRALEALFAILSADRNTSLREILDDTKKLLPENVVQALVGEAFNRLDLTAQQVIQALSIYAPHPVTPVAVDYLLQPYVAGVDSAPVLNRLVNMQFVRKQGHRYNLHPIDRDYALARVAQGEPADRAESADRPFTRFALWRRGADYFEQARKPRAAWKTKDDLDPQLAEFDLRCAGQEYDTAATVLLGIDFDHLYVWGYFRLMAELHERLRGKIKDAGLRHRSLGNLGTALRVIGRVDEARDCYEQALAMARAEKNRYDESVWLGNLANCYQDMGRTARAIECNEQALAIKREIGNRHGQAISLGSLGNCYGDLGQTARAIGYHEEALALAREVNEPHIEGLILNNLAEALIDAERYDQAIGRALEGLKIGQQINSPMVCAYNGHNLSLAYLYAGDLRAARAAVENTRQYDLPEINQSCLRLFGVIAVRQGEPEAAQDAFREAIVQADRVLQHNPQYYLALGDKGIALSGLALCESADYTAAAIEAFRAARAINRDAGITARLLRSLDALALADTAGVLAGVRAAAQG